MIRLMWRSITKSDPYRMIVLTVEYKQLLSEWPLKFLSEKKKKILKKLPMSEMWEGTDICVCVCVFQRTTYFFLLWKFYLQSPKQQKKKGSLVSIAWSKLFEQSITRTCTTLWHIFFVIFSSFQIFTSFIANLISYMPI